MPADGVSARRHAHQEQAEACVYTGLPLGGPGLSHHRLRRGPPPTQLEMGLPAGRAGLGWERLHARRLNELPCEHL
jgi:hypothetical protein